jgi:hypothetical protein
LSIIIPKSFELVDSVTSELQIIIFLNCSSLDFFTVYRHYYKDNSFILSNKYLFQTKFLYFIYQYGFLISLN